MNTIPQTAQFPSRSRRAFLKGVSVLGLASAISARAALVAPVRYAHRFQLFAEGPVTDFSLVWPTPQLPPLPDGALIRIQIRFPIGGRDLLEWQTIVDFAPDQSAIVTLFHMRVDKIGLSRVPEPNFGLFGVILDNPVVDNPNRSPFGDLTGRVGVVFGQFDVPGDHTAFTLFGGAAAGNHASAVSTATGALRIQGAWNSF